MRCARHWRTLLTTPHCFASVPRTPARRPCRPLFDRILDGESPVRVWLGEFRGLKARELAEAAGVSAAYLSDIESSRKPGSARALQRLAEALQVDMNELVASPPA